MNPSDQHKGWEFPEADAAFRAWENERDTQPVLTIQYRGEAYMQVITLEACLQLRTTCPDCEGEGVTLINRSGMGGEAPFDIQASCYFCDGLGEVHP